MSIFSRRPFSLLFRASAAVGLVSALLLCLGLVSAHAAGAAEVQPAQTMADPILFAVAMFLVTTVIGVIASLGGVGGGVVFTPLMMGLTPIDSYIVRATGLLIALIGGLRTARPYLRKGLANMRLILLAAVPYTIFAVLGALMAGYMKATAGPTGESLLRLVMGILVVSIAMLIIFKGKRVEYPEAQKVDGLSKKLDMGRGYWEGSLRKIVNYKVVRAPVGLVLFCCVGLVSGLFGLGAGWAIVPVFNLIMLAPLKVAAASSSVLIGMGDTGAIWPYLMSGAVFPLFAVPSMLGMVVGTTIGSRLISRVKAGSIRWIVIGIMFVSGGKLVFDGLSKLAFSR